MLAVLVKGGICGLLRPSDYDDYCELVGFCLAQSGVTVETVESMPVLGQRLRQSGVDAVVFFTRGMMEEAEGVYGQYGVRVSLLTAEVDGLPRGEVNVVDKMTLRLDNVRSLIMGR